MLIELTHAYSGDEVTIHVVAGHITGLQAEVDGDKKFTKVITTRESYAIKETIPEIREMMEKVVALVQENQGRIFARAFLNTPTRSRETSPEVHGAIVAEAEKGKK